MIKEVVLVFIAFTCYLSQFNSAKFVEKPGCFERTGRRNATVYNLTQCFTICQTKTIGIFHTHCYCEPDPTPSETCFEPFQCRDGHQPCGYGNKTLTETGWMTVNASLSIYELYGCFLKALKNIGNVSLSSDSELEEYGERVNITCNGKRYPSIGTHRDSTWYKTATCIELAGGISRNWTSYIFRLQCNAECDVPKLENGQFSNYSLTRIGKLTAGTNITATCNYGFKLNTTGDIATSTCQEVDSEWAPVISCQPRSSLNCTNNSQDIMSGREKCNCLLGFEGTYCEKEILDGSFTEELLKIKDQTAILTTVGDMASYMIAQMPYEQRISLEIPSNQLISQCSLAGKTCGSYRQNGFVHTGSCYTINFDLNNATIIKRAGKSQGMKLVLFIDEMELLAYSLVNGVKLIIHNQDEPIIPENQGRFISPDFHVSIAMKYVQINKAMQKCASEEVLSSLNYLYNENCTVEGCFKSCHQQKVIKTCGCGDPNSGLNNTAKNVAYCTVKDRECVNSVTSAMDENCKCPEGCRNSIYETTYSFANWPSKYHKSALCKHLAEKETTWKDKFLKECNEFYRTSHAKVDIFYADLSYFVYTEYSPYTAWTLWSAFGSILAIFFGVSYIFFFETLVLILEMAKAAVKKQIRKWRKKFSVGAKEH